MFIFGQYVSLAVQAKPQAMPVPPEVQLQKKVLAPIYQGTEKDRTQLASISATAVYVMDRNSGSILFEKNAYELLYPASTVKMLTALVARQNYSLEDPVVITNEAFTTGTVVGFQVGQQFSVRELLQGALIESGNDAAFALANHHVLGYEGFVAAMNQKATELHLSQTHLSNPSGLDNSDQQMTARDLAILANELMKDEVLRQVVSTKQVTLIDQKLGTKYPLFKRNELLGKDGIIGVKTGTTEFAGENLVTAVSAPDHEFIIVVMSSKDRYADTQRVLNWVKQHYTWETFAQE